MKYLFSILITGILLTTTSLAERVYLDESFKKLQVPSGWKNIDNDKNILNSKNGLRNNLKNGEGWTIQYESNYGMGECVASTSYFENDGQADDWLITNQIQLENNLRLTWDAASINYSSGYHQSYQVLISVTGTEFSDFKVIQNVDKEYPLCHRRFDLKDYENKKIYLAFRNTSQNVKNGFLAISKIKIYSPAMNNITITNLKLSPFDTLGCLPIPIKGWVGNDGYNVIDSFDLNYQINDEEIKTAVMKMKLGNQYGGTNPFEHPIPWKPTSAKANIVKVWVSMANGVEDTVQSGNEKSRSVYIGEKYHNKLSLYEEFTSSSCGPCATANRIFNKFTDNHMGEYVLIKYPMIGPAPGDPYFNEDGRLRLVHYYSAVPGYPYLFVNGMYGMTPSDTTSIIARSQEHALIDIDGTYNVYMENNEHKIDVDVDLNCAFTGNGSNHLVLYVAVVENKTTQNATSNGETEFHMVEHKMLPHGYGTPLTDLINVDTLSKKFTYTFDSTSHVEEYGDLSVVIFVQDIITNVVLGTAWATWVGTDVEYKINTGNGIVGLFPNPASENIYLGYMIKNSANVRIEIYNLEGKIINSINNDIMDYGIYVKEINTNKLNNGTYILKLCIADQSFSKLFIVNR